MTCGHWGQLVTAGEQSRFLRNDELWSISPPAMSVFKSIGFKRSQDLTSFLLEEGDKSNLEQNSYLTKLFSPFPVFLLSRKGVSSRQKFFFPFLLHLFCLFVLLDFFLHRPRWISLWWEMVTLLKWQGTGKCICSFHAKRLKIAYVTREISCWVPETVWKRMLVQRAIDGLANSRLASERCHTHRCKSFCIPSEVICHPHIGLQLCGGKVVSWNCRSIKVP